jgi:hypothetical protein
MRRVRGGCLQVWQAAYGTVTVALRSLIKRAVMVVNSGGGRSHLRSMRTGCFVQAHAFGG